MKADPLAAHRTVESLTGEGFLRRELALALKVKDRHQPTKKRGEERERRERKKKKEDPNSKPGFYSHSRYFIGLTRQAHLMLKLVLHIPSFFKILFIFRESFSLTYSFSFLLCLL